MTKFYSQTIIKMHKQTKQPITKVHREDKANSSFICSVDDDSFIFQTKSLFLQVQFNSLKKQVCQYLQQYQKYCFLAQVSSIGIKAHQQKQLYEKITELVNKQHRKYLQKTMDYIEQMIMNIHFMKSQIWHYYSQLIKGYRTNLLNTNVDCYSFNPSQFCFYQNVIKYLDQRFDKSDQTELTKIKAQIKKNEKQIKKKINNINENMFVKNPFVTENVAKKQIKSSQLFDSYLKEVICQTKGLGDSLSYNFHNSYCGIQKFAIFLNNFSIEGQKTASSIIKNYNLHAIQFGSSIKEIEKAIEKNQEQGWQQSSNLNINVSRVPSIIQNKTEKVSIYPEITNKYAEPGHLFCLNDDKKDENFNSQNFTLKETTICVDNQYLDVWSQRYDRQKLRKLRHRHQKSKIPQKAKLLNQSPVYKEVSEDKTTITPNLLSNLIKQLERQELIIWKKEEAMNIHIQRTNQNERNDTELKVVKQKESKIQQQQKLMQGYKIYLEKHKKEQSSINIGMKKSSDNKEYLLYLQHFGIKDITTQNSKTSIYRFGIRIEKTLFNNTNIPKLQEFCCNYLREKLYRQVSKYQQKDCMPLMFNTKTAQELCNWRTIKRLGQLTQNMKKYYIWGSDVIKYEQITSIDKQKVGKFTIFTYNNPKYGESILFELKRRLNITVTGEIVIKHQDTNNSSFDYFLSKLELIYRLTFSTCLETADMELNIWRGFHIYNQMVKQLENE